MIFNQFHFVLKENNVDYWTWFGLKLQEFPGKIQI